MRGLAGIECCKQRSAFVAQAQQFVVHPGIIGDGIVGPCPLLAAPARFQGGGRLSVQIRGRKTTGRSIGSAAGRSQKIVVRRRLEAAAECCKQHLLLARPPAYRQSRAPAGIITPVAGVGRRDGGGDRPAGAEHQPWSRRRRPSIVIVPRRVCVGQRRRKRYGIR
ncbi:hypothetical protein D3C72_1531070 [compost metagenome]